RSVAGYDRTDSSCIKCSRLGRGRGRKPHTGRTLAMKVSASQMDKHATLLAYRDKVRHACAMFEHTRSLATDSELFAYVSLHHRQAKDRIARHAQTGTTDGELDDQRLGLFVFAAGLVSYGNLLAAEDLLDSIPT